MSTLTFTEVRKAYGPQEVLRGATFFVPPGGKTALIGPNGAGKTTLLRLAAGVERPDGGRVTLLSGTRAALMDQEPLVGDARTVLESAQRPSAGHQAAWAELLAHEGSLTESGGDGRLEAYDQAHQRYQELGGYECETRAREVLAGLGLAQETWERPVALLSGGERTRLALTQLLVLQPDLLLLDEPTNHVDWKACEWLQEYLARYPGAALIVSHDRYFLDRVVREVVALEDGVTRTYRGNYSTYARRRAEERLQSEERYRREQEEIERQEQVVQRLRSHRKFNSMHSREKVLGRLQRQSAGPPLRESKGITVRPLRTRNSSQVALTTADLAFGFGSRTLFSRVSFTLERGERLGVIGPNGAGKSTLLKTLVGQLRPAAGQVSLGFNVEAVYFAQDLSSLDPGLTVFETVDSAADLSLSQVFQALHQFLFMGSAVEKPVSVLSGGERTRLALARLLVRCPNLLVLDEPTNHLDVQSCEALESALASFPGALIAASHDRYFLERVPTRLLEIRPEQHRFIQGGYERYRELVALPPARTAPSRATSGRPGGRTRPARAASPARRLKELEQAIEAAEARLRELADLLAAPETYRGESPAVLAAEYDRINTSLESLYGEWGELAEAIE